MRGEKEKNKRTIKIKVKSRRNKKTENQPENNRTHNYGFSALNKTPHGAEDRRERSKAAWAKGEIIILNIQETMQCSRP